ncbi:hypothetical protein KDL44_09220 [bacterium]|nr:hypothetical protein [bacterium]
MKRFACVIACFALSITIFGCSGSNAGSNLDSRIVSDAPGSAQIEAAWDMFAASYNFDNVTVTLSFGDMYNGSEYAADMFRLGEDINDELNYDTGIQNQDASVLFCEFTGDGRPKND